MPPPLRSVPEQPSAPGPLLTGSWQAGVTGWIVVFGAVLAELVAGIVTNRMPTAIAAPALAFPVAVAAGFAVVQWWQVRAYTAERPSWWHLVGIAGAAFAWLVWPTATGALAPAGSARAACIILQNDVTPACLSRAAAAMDYRSLVWWLTGALIAGAALLARRSRIAAWAAIPTAIAGCLLASHFLELLLLDYHAGG